MTTKQYLMQYRLLDKQIDARSEELQRLRARLQSLTASYSDMPRGGQRKDWTDLSDKCLELEAELNADMERLIRTRHDVLVAIESVQNPTWRTVLEMRYISGWPWPRIMHKLNYADSTLYEIHYMALQAVVIPESA